VRWPATTFVLFTLTACAQERSESVAGGSAASSPTPSEPAGSAAATAAIAPASGSSTAEPPRSLPTQNAGPAEIAQFVVRDVGSKALGRQKIEASCVSVLVLPAGEWSVAAARLKGCGDKTARSILWLYKRQGNGKWSEDYVGQPPPCWKAVPPDIAEAVAKATKIPTC
jgi:hypothetical protein